MNIPYKYLLLRFYAHLMLTLLGLYSILVVIVSNDMLGLVQAFIFFIAFISSIIMYKTYQKASHQPKLMTVKEKTILEYSVYVYVGLYISRTILMTTPFAYLNLYVGIILVFIAGLTSIMIYKMMK